jgi:hypothetical protein
MKEPPMELTPLHQRIARRGSDKEQIARDVIKRPELVPELLNGIHTGKGGASIKFCCSKILILISESKPELLYPYFDQFVDMLDWDNKFLMWGAIIVIGNLAKVDSKGKFEKIFVKYYAPITGSVMVTAANVIGSSAVIAQAKPKLTERITKELLKVDKAHYETPECRKVAIGHTLCTFDQYFDWIKDKRSVLAFVRKQTKSTRKTVAKKAAEFLSKHGL